MTENQWDPVHRQRHEEWRNSGGGGGCFLEVPFVLGAVTASGYLIEWEERSSPFSSCQKVKLSGSRVYIIQIRTQSWSGPCRFLAFWC